jgi:hypothetical protein
MLINAHFDSTIGTMGAADAAIPVSAMIELLSNAIHLIIQ